MDLGFYPMQILSAFVILFVLIDALGSLPIFLTLQAEGKDLHPSRSALSALLLTVGFLFVGEWILRLFSVDVSSFAIAGGLVIFVVSLEMIFGIKVFKEDAPGKGNSTFVPVVFPLLAGPAIFTALLTMSAELTILSILIALVINMIIVYFILRNLGGILKLIGENGVYLARKFFGIIIMAISVKIMTENIIKLIGGN